MDSACGETKLLESEVTADSVAFVTVRVGKMHCGRGLKGVIGVDEMHCGAGLKSVIGVGKITEVVDAISAVVVVETIAVGTEVVQAGTGSPLGAAFLLGAFFAGVAFFLA